MAEDNTRARPRIQRAAAATLALPLRGSVFFPVDWPGWHRWILRGLAIEAEQRRLFPWIAVCFGLGIILFFQAEGRPALWAPLTGAALFAGLAVLARARPVVLAALIGLVALFSGFAAAALRVRIVEAPVISRVMITRVGGFVEAVEDRPGNTRILLRVVEMGRVPVAEQPRRIRVTVRNAKDLVAGQYIEATARILPPPQPVWPGGYDFARDAFFREIGAVGSVVGPVRRAAPPHSPGWQLQLAAAVDEARNMLTERIATAVGGSSGAVAAALVTGKRGLIEEQTNDVLRAAGIYHIVSISGLHMVLAAGTFFWLVRAVLALAPTVALLWPVKKIAASVAMVGAVAYCVFSGSEVATERSLIMTLVMLGAILVDRPALSMRNCTVAALIVLAREPETLLGPSFQMSFGAVVALTAIGSRLNLQVIEGHPRSAAELALRWLVRSLVGLLAMTLVASLATAPFAVYHFQTLTPFGLIGNALALPLVSLVVMPAGLLGVLAYPFGLDRPVWEIMGAAVARIIDVSEWVSGFGGSTIVVPAIGVGAMALLGLALLTSTLMASSLRWLALVPAGAGLAFAATPERFDIFVDREGAGAAIRGRAGRLVLVGKPSDFVVEQWLRADGDPRSPRDTMLRHGARCDRAGCVVEKNDGLNVAFVQDLAAFEEDCRRAAVVIARIRAPTTCDAGLVLDRALLERHGAVAVRYKDGAAILHATVAEGEPPSWAGPLRRAAPDRHPNRADAPSSDARD